MQQGSSEPRCVAQRSSELRAAAEFFGTTPFSAGLFGVRRFDPWPLRSPGRLSYPPLRRWPSGQQCDKRARAVLRDRSGLMDAVAVSSSPRACDSKLRTPSLLFGGAPVALRSGHWGVLRNTPHGLSLGQASVRLRADQQSRLRVGLQQVPRSLGDRLRVVRLVLHKGPAESAFGQVRVVHGGPQSLRAAGSATSTSDCFGNRTAFGQFKMCAAECALPSGSVAAAQTNHWRQAR